MKRHYHMSTQTWILIAIVVVFFLMGIIGIFLKNPLFLIFPNIAVFIVAGLAIQYMSSFIKDGKKKKL